MMEMQVPGKEREGAIPGRSARSRYAPFKVLKVYYEKSIDTQAGERYEH